MPVESAIMLTGGRFFSDVIPCTLVKEKASQVVHLIKNLRIPTSATQPMQANSTTARVAIQGDYEILQENRYFKTNNRN